MAHLQAAMAAREGVTYAVESRLAIAGRARAELGPDREVPAGLGVIHRVTAAVRRAECGPPGAVALPAADAGMSHKHESLLRTIFHDPISGNIHWREIESLLNHVGAEVEPLSGARIRVRLNGAEGILHRPHHGNTLDRSAVRHLREYLAHAQMTPSQYEAVRQRA
jgi:HicA toxin of bacterial toxin-antitoxin,